MILAGSSHPQLAQDLSHQLHLPLGDVDISRFPNGEKRIWIKSPLKGQTVIIVQSFSQPVDEHIIEFCLLADAAHQGEAKKIIGLVPWFGYSPQDKLFRPGEPISAQVMAKLIAAVGVDHFVTVDIHSPETLKHFSIPTTEVTALPLFIDHFKITPNSVVAALDTGALDRSQRLAQALNLPELALTKTRDRSTGDISFTKFAENLTGKHVIAWDDFVSTGSTIIQAAKALKQQGALSYTQCITHAVLAGDASTKLALSSIDTIIATDSYPIPASKKFDRLTILPLAPLLAKALTPLLQ